VHHVSIIVGRNAKWFPLTEKSLYLVKDTGSKNAKTERLSLGQSVFDVYVSSSFV
jgi:hypothetical protein